MINGVNKVIIIGCLGKDPEIKRFTSGGVVVNISVATSEARKDKQYGENKESAEWHRIVFFNRLAEIAGEYLKKGSKVYIEGKLQTRSWEDKSGNIRYITEIVASSMQMLDSKSPASEAATINKPVSAANTEPPQSSSDFDDDIPF